MSEMEVDPTRVATTSAEKRAAETGSEGPDSKKPKPPSSKTPGGKAPPIVPKPATHGPFRSESLSDGILSVLSQQFKNPRISYGARIVQVDTSLMNGYFQSLYDSIANAMYPSSKIPMNAVITKANFVIACRYYMKSRIDNVYSSVTGRRPDHRIGVARAVELPKALSDIINRIGVHLAQAGALRFIPKPEDTPADIATRLQTVMSYDMQYAFAQFVQDARNAGIIQTGYITSTEVGTAWWVISARKIDKPEDPATEDDAVKVGSCFSEFTPADALLCAMVQRQNTGLEAESDISLKWTFGEIENVPSLRAAYNLQA